MGHAEDRRFDVLRAIVADFVSTKEPIGSKTLVERHNLGVSSATVRNDMAVLEAEGYITQPHTSSGRVPTEKGYREFVDRLDDVKPLSSAERRAIQGFLESGVDLDDVSAPRRPAARAADPPGGRRPVSDAVSVDRPARRGGRVDAGAAAAGRDHRLGPRRPARRRARRRHRRPPAGPAARHARPGAGRQAPVGGLGRGGRPGIGDRPQPARWATRSAGRRRCCWNRWSSTPRTGCCWAAPPT